MSVNILWKPVLPFEYKSTNGGGQLSEVLRKAFGDYPIEIESCQENVSIIKGIICCGVPGANEILSALIEHSKIEVIEKY